MTFRKCHVLNPAFHITLISILFSTPGFSKEIKIATVTYTPSVYYGVQLIVELKDKRYVQLGGTEAGSGARFIMNPERFEGVLMAPMEGAKFAAIQDGSYITRHGKTLKIKNDTLEEDYP